MHSPGRRLWTAGCQSRQDRGSGGEAHTNTARLDLPGRHTAFTFTPSLASDASLRRSSPTLTRCCVLGADERESVQGCAHRLLPRLNAHLATPPDLDGGAGDQRPGVVTDGAGGHPLGPGRVGLHVEHPGRPDSEKRHVRRVVSPKQLRTGSPGSPRPALARHRLANRCSNCHVTIHAFLAPSRRPCHRGARVHVLVAAAMGFQRLLVLTAVLAPACGVRFTTQGPACAPAASPAHARAGSACCCVSRTLCARCPDPVVPPVPCGPCFAVLQEPTAVWLGPFFRRSGLAVVRHAGLHLLACVLRRGRAQPGIPRPPFRPSPLWSGLLTRVLSAPASPCPPPATPPRPQRCWTCTRRAR